jgi:glutathione S-transferase
MTDAAAKRIVWGVATSRTLRAHWMLSELELPYERRPITSRSGETLTPDYTRLNPSQKIPTLQDGDLVAARERAIVNYLATNYGAARKLCPPASPRERARYDQWCFCDDGTRRQHAYVIRKHEDLHKLYGEAPNARRPRATVFRDRRVPPKCVLRQVDLTCWVSVSAARIFC